MEPLATAAICDDARMEINGKPFIIGLYPQAMLFTELPATLAQIVIPVTVFSDINDPITKFTVHVMAPGSEFSFDYDFGPMPPPIFPDPIRAEICATIPIRPFVAKEPGVLSVTVRHAAGELRARRLIIQLVPDFAIERISSQPEPVRESSKS
jgi:hypothetical protein